MSSIQGMDRLLARLSKLEQIGRGPGVKDGITQACRIVEDAAVDNCPYDTYNLAESITSETPGANDDPVGIVGTNTDYAPYVEMGTGLFAVNGDGRDKNLPWRYQDDKGNWHTTYGQKPQPYLGPALRDNVDKVVGKIADGIREDLEGTG